MTLDLDPEMFAAFPDGGLIEGKRYTVSAHDCCVSEVEFTGVYEGTSSEGTIRFDCGKVEGDAWNGGVSIEEAAE